MKKGLCLLLALALLVVYGTCFAEEPLDDSDLLKGESLGEPIYEDENVQYWLHVPEGWGERGLAQLWGKNLTLPTGLRFISEITDAAFFNGIPIFIPRQSLSQTKQVFMSLWRADGNVEFVYVYPEPAIVKGLIDIWTLDAASDKYIVIYQIKSSIYLCLTEGSIYNTSALAGKFETINRHNEFFYLTNKKGELSFGTINAAPLQVTSAGKMKKGSLPVLGKDYLAWFSANGELCYTINGSTIEKVPPLPQNTQIEFYEDCILANYENFWITKIVPNTAIGSAEYIPVSQKEALTLRNTATPLSPYPVE